MNISSFTSAFGRFVCTLLGFCVITDAMSAPRIPTRLDEVLTQLPVHAVVQRGTGERSRRTWDDAGTAAVEAIHWIEQGRAELDPRYLGRAQAVLARWWSLSNPPVEIQLLRATIRQSLHDFRGALTDLEAVTHQDPRNAQAWVTKSTLHTLRGEWTDARESALQFASLSSRLGGAAAAAAVGGVNGQLRESFDLLQSALQVDRGAADVSLRLWSLTLLGEMAQRLGNDVDAERSFKRALALGRRDAYLLGAFADFLLSSDRNSEARELLLQETQSDGLLLRLTLAEAGSVPPSPDMERHMTLLQQRFTSARLRGDRIHQREEARFSLTLLHQPQIALRLAQENWSNQKEPADVKILLEAAMAAGHSGTVNQVRQWLLESELQDVSLHRMLSIHTDTK